MATKNTIKKDTRFFQVIKNGIVLEFLSEPEGGYTVSVPSLPGCVSYGETFEMALTMVKEAMHGWIEVARAEGIPIPEQFTGKKAVTLWKDLPALRAREVVAALVKAGFEVKRQSGSHVILFSPVLKRPLTVPMHTKDLPTGTLHAIIRQANLTIDEFLGLLE